MRKQEPWHGPDRWKTDRRILGVQVLFKSAETGNRQIGGENLIADPVERVEPPESFLGIGLALVGNRFVQGNFLAEQPSAERCQIRFELVVFFGACIGTKHARREATKTSQHFQGVGHRQAGRELELFQIDHGRAAVEAHAGALVANFRYGRPRRSARSGRAWEGRSRDQ